MSWARLLNQTLDALQHLPLSEEATGCAYRATYVPTFSSDLVLELSAPSASEAVLELRTLLPVLSFRQLSSATADLKLHRVPPVLPVGLPDKPLLSIKATVSPGDLAGWLRAIGTEPLGLRDDVDRQGRDGMVMFGEACQPPRHTTFRTWQPDPGSPWDNDFRGLHTLAVRCITDPTAQDCLAQVGRYLH